MSSTNDLGAAMRRQLRQPVIAILAVLIYGGSAVLLALFWFSDARGLVEPWIGTGMTFVLVGFTVAVALRAKKQISADSVRR